MADGGGSGWVFTEANYNNQYTSSAYTGGEWLLDNKYFLDAESYTIGGNNNIPTHDGTGTIPGNVGDGYAKITIISSVEPAELKLKGKDVVTILKGASYIDKGAILIKDGIDISNEIETSGSVDVNTVGEYVITYSYYDADINETYVVTRTIIVIEGTNEFGYTKEMEEFIVPVTGVYRLEVWGGKGGDNTDSGGTVGGKGGYSTGLVTLTAGDILYVYTGGAGEYASVPGFNGGGGAEKTNTGGAAGGGGASDIRINKDTLYARAIVAGRGRPEEDLIQDQAEEPEEES